MAPGVALRHALVMTSHAEMTVRQVQSRDETDDYKPDSQNGTHRGEERSQKGRGRYGQCENEDGRGLVDAAIIECA